MIAMLAVALGLVLSLGLAETFLHARRLQRVPIRIHVNGTRGKSSVTRLIAAGLRGGGIRTCAKTTGTATSMIFSDGSEYPFFRPLGPNVIEQTRVVRAAAETGAEALVVECMALQPPLQSLCELRLLRSTHGVITNARPDHLEKMGPTPRDVALALAGTTPVRSRLFTAERRFLDVFRAAAADRGTELVDVDAAEVGEAEMAGFDHVEHPQNVALALRVCEAVGVPRRTALEAMWEAEPDPGAMRIVRVDAFERRVVFANAFSANDPDSTREAWELALARHPDVDRRIALFNCRADRPERSKQLAAACVEWPPADRYVAMGTGTLTFIRALQRAGIPPDRIVMAEERSPERLFELVLELAGDATLVVGMGNSGNGGLELASYLARRGRSEAFR
jgi:poly-gamma-glutamate synthase PgsB/CapB